MDASSPCVISCILGPNFTTVYPAPRSYPSHFFTNNPGIREEVVRKGWLYEFLDLPLTPDIAESSMQSKYVKYLQFLNHNAFAHFNRCSSILYVDHKGHLKDKHVAYLTERCTRGVLAQGHIRKRKTIWEEVGEAMFHERYVRTMPQTIAYIRENLDRGRSETPVVCNTGLMVYRPNVEGVRTLLNEVYRDVVTIPTPECQIVWAMVSQSYREVIQVGDDWRRLNMAWEVPKDRTAFQRVMGALKTAVRMVTPFGLIQVWQAIKEKR